MNLNYLSYVFTKNCPHVIDSNFEPLTEKIKDPNNHKTYCSVCNNDQYIYQCFKCHEHFCYKNKRHFLEHSEKTNHCLFNIGLMAFCTICNKNVTNKKIEANLNEIGMNVKEENLFENLLKVMLKQRGDNLPQVGVKNVEEEKVSPSLIFEQANSKLQLGKNNEAVQLFEKSASLGHLKSFESLGDYYTQNYKYSLPNFKKGLEYYEKGGQKGCKDCYFKLGDIFLYDEMDGGIIPRDTEKAIFYYKKAGKLGSVGAFGNLGIIYHLPNVSGIKMNIQKAIKYYTIGSDMGATVAHRNLVAIYQDQEPDIEKAIFYNSRLVEIGDEAAIGKLGYFYYHGEGFERDIYKGVKYYEMAASKGDLVATQNLGIVYANNPKFLNKKKAVEYYERSLELEGGVSAFNLGFIHMTGDGIPVDTKKAVFYYIKAADMGNFKSQLFVADLYLNGKHIKVDPKKSLHYLSLAKKTDPYDPRIEYYTRHALSMQNNPSSRIFYSLPVDNSRDCGTYSDNYSYSKKKQDFDVHLITFCNLCGEEKSGLKWCSRCRSVKYCSVDCQKKDWASHKLSCNK